MLTAFVALASLALSIADYAVVRRMLRGNVQEQLELRAQGLSEVLLAHVLQQEERARLVASRTRLRALLRQSLDGEIPRSAFEEESARILRDALASTQSFLAIRMADLDGTIVTATDPDVVGTSVANDSAFVDGLVEPTHGLPRVNGETYRAIVSAPARTNDGRPLGVVLVDVDARPMIGILGALPSKFESGEVRLGALVRNRPRYLFEEPGSRLEAADDPPLVEALAGRAGFESIAGFRGRDVLVAYRGVGYHGWGLVTQVDAREAYQPITRLSALVAGAGALVAVLALLVAVRVASRITRPIQALSGVVERVGRGDLDARAAADSRDEVGFLGGAFNAMAGALQSHQNELQDVVLERTRGLEQRTAQLQQSHAKLAEMCRLLEDQAEEMERDLRRAAHIQRSLLPAEPPELRGYCVHTLYRPGRNVGGDLYDVIAIGDEHLALVVADASGHGVSAALLSVLFKHRLRAVDRATGEPLAPKAALARLNGALCEGATAPGVFFTCAYGLLHLPSRELTIASAGHPPIVCSRADGAVDVVEHTGPALGLSRDAGFDERQLVLAERDRVLLFTDGLFDAGDGTPLEPAAIADLVRKHGADEMGLEHLLVEASGGREREDRDDVTLLLLEAAPGDSHYHDRGEGIDLEVEASEPAVVLSRAEADGTTFLLLRGRATWTQGTALLDEGARAIDGGDELVVDLDGCRYLDSTMLGTLHELARRADEAGASLSLQNVAPAVLASFEEVSMDRVLARVASEARDVPAERRPVEAKESDLHRQRRRLLAAHEELARLSDANRAQFGAVVEALRREEADS